MPIFSNRFTIIFVTVMCFVAALFLSLAAVLLKGPQAQARQLDAAKQILTAARIYHPKGYFQVLTSDGSYAPARYDSEQSVLVSLESDSPPTATPTDIYAVFHARIKPLLTDDQGHVETFAEAGIDQETYIEENQQKGFAELSKKLFYQILSNIPHNKSQPEGYILPVAGFGLWGPIYGYVALKEDANTVIGINWEAPKETPGLGANIQDPPFLEQFFGKKIFQKSAEGTIDYLHAPIGITVVKGKVRDVYGSSPKAECAVDGVSGATCTTNGVSAAYVTSLRAYRGLLKRVATKEEK
jgi:Na+-transporting NADH:ubiquinone oxidoreductase subunit C